MKIITISGHARHGKDTVAQMLKENLEEHGNCVLITHYGDLVKYICRMFFDWNGEKDEYGRGLLQTVGTDIIRRENPDYWVDFIVGILKFFPDGWDVVIIPDTRFPNEIQGLRENGFDVSHLRVVRPDFDNGLTDEQKKHPSETALDHTKPDWTLVNDSTLEHLELLAEEYLKENIYG